MKTNKQVLIKIIRKEIDKTQEYYIDFIEGEYHYVSFGPSYYTWPNFWKAPATDPRYFGSFNSVQAAKKAFLKKYYREDNNYKYTKNATRLLKNGKPIFGTSNGQLFKK